MKKGLKVTSSENNNSSSNTLPSGFLVEFPVIFGSSDVLIKEKDVSTIIAEGANGFVGDNCDEFVLKCFEFFHEYEDEQVTVVKSEQVSKEFQK